MKKSLIKKNIRLHPVMFIFMLCFIAIILSGILRLFDFQATFSKINVADSEYQVTSEAIRSMFNLTGLKYIFTTTVSAFANFAPLSHLLIILIGIGVMVKSEFLKAIITLHTKKAKKVHVTFVFTLICIISSIIGDLSYVIFIPIGSLLFLYGKRSPIVGAISAYAALTCGHALSLFITSIDSSLITITANNVSVIRPGFSINSFGFLFIMIILIVLLSIIITNITENITSKKLPKYEFDEEQNEEFVVTKSVKRGLLLSLFGGIIYLIIFIYNIIPNLPFSGKFLDNTQALYIDKLFSYNSFFNNGFVFIVAVFFVILGLCYGIGAKTIKNNSDFVDSLSHSLNKIGKIVVFIFVASLFINIFKRTNIGNTVAGYFVSVISSSNFSAIPAILLLFFGSIVTSFFLPNAISSWTILSGCIPTLMKLGLSPAFIQLIFRLGSSVVLPITPVFAYFIIYLAYIEHYNQDEKPISFMTSIKYLLPYVLATLVIYIVMILLFYILGFNIGIATSVAL